MNLTQLIKSTALLSILFLAQVKVYSQAKTTASKNAATKQETIDWLIEKIKVLFAENKERDGGVSVDWSELKIMDNSTISITQYTKWKTGNKTYTHTEVFDFDKFINYHWEAAVYSSLTNCEMLVLTCSGCVNVNSNFGDGNDTVTYMDTIGIHLRINQEMKKRFINALEHLKKLSSHNKEKF